MKYTGYLPCIHTNIDTHMLKSLKKLLNTRNLIIRMKTKTNMIVCNRKKNGAINSNINMNNKSSNKTTITTLTNSNASKPVKNTFIAHNTTTNSNNAINSNFTKSTTTRNNCRKHQHPSIPNKLPFTEYKHYPCEFYYYKHQYY